MRHHMIPRPDLRVALAAIASVLLVLCTFAGTATASTPEPVVTEPVVTEPEPQSTPIETAPSDDPTPTTPATPVGTTVADTHPAPAPTAPAPTPSAAPTAVPTTLQVEATEAPSDTEAPPDTDVDEPVETSRLTALGRPSASPSVRASGIPVSSILLALFVLASVGAAAVVVARRRGDRTVLPHPSRQPDIEQRPTPDVETLEFLVEIGSALLDAGDAVSHVEATLRRIADVNEIRGLGLLVLPTSLVLSFRQDDSIITEVGASTSNPLRLDQIDDVIRLVNDVERGDVPATEGLRSLSYIRSRPPVNPAPLRLFAYVIATIGLAMILRGSWVEVALAAALGVVIGALRLATESQQAAYQVFWPLISAVVVSASVFATTRVFTDLAVFPALVAPLVSFLPGGLLTIGVLELSTGQIISGASRLAAGAMKLVLLAIGIAAGAQLVGVPGGDIRDGSSGTLSTFIPWLGVALFGIGIARFNGARRQSLVWILVALYVAYAGQVLGGVFFGSALSAFFGAVAMTPVALFASRQRLGPTPLVTFLPGFWLLVPGALGLEGVTRFLGQGAAGSTGALTTTVTSMIGIALGLLVGLIISGADPARPWSDSPRRES